MNNKADVKAIMARFNTGGNATEGVSTGRPKVAVHPTLSSGLPIQPKKPILETSLSGSAASTTPKPNFLKSTVSTKSAPEVRESPKAKALASMFGGAQEDTKPPFMKQFTFKPKPPESSQDPESKNPIPKSPLQKPSLSSILSDAKPPFLKPCPATAKPQWLKDSPKPEDSGGTSNAIPPKIPSVHKPISTITQMWQQPEEGGATDSKVRPFPGSAPKPPSNFRTAQNAFNKDRGDVLSEDGGKEGANPPVSSSNSSVPKPPTNKKPSFVKKPLCPIPQVDHSAPRRNPLPNIFALGSAPAKPNRPPRVNLDKFNKGTEVTCADGPGFKKGSVPPPPASHPGNHAAPPLPSHPVAPSLPPRPPGVIIQPDLDENYDDVGLMNCPPLLPSGGHPSQRTEDSGSDEEMYEDLDERWGPMESKEQEKKREKEEKKRQEMEKKEQKERERKEQEARKKFKLSGPLLVIHKVKARVDCRGGKTDLGMKQGESIDIIRVLDNPEGRWLGKTQDGSYGYVKTDSVEIDFDSLKRASVPSQWDHEPEVYDDVACHDDFCSGIKGPGVVLPPPPEEDGDIYDDLDDPSFDVRIAPPFQFTPEGHSDQSAAVIDEDIYDDVDSRGFPPLPPLNSLPQLKTKSKAEEMDPKKMKKFEKEEKDFRKKFKFDGEIQVLYRVTIVSTLANKKWSSKDLPLRPGETVDVVVKAIDNKLICRNEEGKFGHVLTSHIVVEDADIYDDIGDDCIYDNE